MTGRASFPLGVLGGVLLVLFWLGGIAPERSDALLGPYGLLIWFGILMAAIVLPLIAAIRGSKWWYLLVLASAITAVRFYLLVMT